MPVEDATEEQLLTKKMAFEGVSSKLYELRSTADRVETKMTTHWPNAMHVVDLPVYRNGEPDPYNRHRPRKPVQLSERGFKLTGIPYLKASA